MINVNVRRSVDGDVFLNIVKCDESTHTIQLKLSKDELRDLIFQLGVLEQDMNNSSTEVRCEN